MKSKLLFLSLIIAFTVNSQSLTWSWARRTTSGLNTNQGQSITTTTASNIYVAGPYNSGITFGTYTLSGTGIYVAKYDSLGNLLFAFKAAGSILINSVKITSDNSGNVILAGSYNNNLTVGATTLSATGLQSFIAKYDGSGNPLWVKALNGSNVGYVYDVTTDAGNNPIVTGSFTGTLATIATTTLSNTNFSALNNAYTAKFDPNGNVLWVKKPNGVSDGRTLKTDVGGNVYVAGNFSDSLFFGTTKLLKLGSGNDIFIVKYDQNGNFVWAFREGGKSADEVYGSDLDAANNFYITGMFVDVATGFAVGTSTVTGPNDIYLAKFDSNGNGLWITNAGGTNYDYGRDVAIDASGNPFVVCYFESPSITAGSYTLTNTAGGGPGGFNDIAVIKFNSSGTILAATNPVGAKTDYGYGICADTKNNVYITGSAQSNTLAFGTQSLTLPGFDNFYVARLKGGNTLGVETIQMKNVKVDIYPNPNNGEFKISLDNSVKEVAVSIISVTGVIVWEHKNIDSLIDVKLNLPKGLYFVNVKDNEGNFETKKILIQ